MRVSAYLKSVRLSAQKGRLVADLVRGKSVDEALNILTFCPKKGAVLVKKLLESAIANAEHNEGADIDTLKVAAIFECKQVRGDLIRDNKRPELMRARLKALENRRIKLEALLQVHLPHLANGESLFPEFDSYRLREYNHVGYRKLVKQIAVAKNGIIDGTKFDRLFSYRLANLHYLVVEADLLDAHEVPTGWGLLVRRGDDLQLVSKPAWQDIHVEHQLVFLQRIAARKTFQKRPERYT